METNQITENYSDNSTAAPALKTPKRRISKLTADEVANLPGANPVPEKKVEPELTYYLFFVLSVSDLIGNPAEAAQVYGFASQLDAQAKSKGVGSVVNIGAANGSFEVVLKLATMGEQASHAVPINNAFAQLKENLSASPLLHQGSAGKPAMWKAKVNGTTIADGKF